MHWPQLLTADRLVAPPDTEGDARSPFERDYGRILFSNAFRRLHNKTQVFPMPDNDHVHSRLTHSLEVASVGATLGKTIGAEVVRRHDLVGIQPGHLGDVVAAACLAHDLGNPPFGHAGEAAIGHYFAGQGAEWLAPLSAAQRADFERFEGNAQGFRLIARTQMYSGEGGMRLTKAVLGAFAKYPQGSLHAGDKARAGGKKFGWFDAEAPLFTQVASACGLLPVAGVDGAWHRHPLAFVMEAADDICYHVLDLEDGVSLRLVDARLAAELFGALLDRDPATLSNRPVSVLRAKAINKLVHEVTAAFLDAEGAILAGRFDRALVDAIPSAAAMRHVFAENMRLCYRSEVVLGLEQAGYTVIGGLLAALLDSVFDRKNPHLRQILPDGIPPDGRRYETLLAVTDWISGMTDRYALRKYQQWTGIALESV